MKLRSLLRQLTLPVCSCHFTRIVLIDPEMHEQEMPKLLRIEMGLLCCVDGKPQPSGRANGLIGSISR